ncbi:CoxG family protein [Hydrogenophaga crocea]|uniref:Carbon monoxide dehydrogenase subunit G n=1 Tax=Hydrogenophaga crocea TaxID=2716225 RepID=A0A6G8IK53_9BURK|nr:carbon monoxide dehydrogenase subunit G [Hydrogenophaga crocea]QIM53408.1 carbon monoxide dehydrogenase subunit G [Hydrogenophaga crocea]
MDIQGEKILQADRDTVWRALNDPRVLQRCLAGCDTFEADGDNRYRVAMAATVGPVRARFAGKLELRDVQPPTSYALNFEGSGGVAGFGKGSASVALDDVAEGTRLRYRANAQVGGRLAQVGARLIDGVTRRMADDFFTRFVRELSAPADGAGDTAAQPMRPAAAPATAPQAAPALVPTAQVPATAGTSANTIAVIAAAVSATAASVAVLAAVLALRAG